MKPLAALASALAALLVTGPLPAQTPVPILLNYQGRVVVGTVNFNSPPDGLFKFALVNAAGTTAYWSNDGTLLGPITPTSQPTAAVAITVTKGLCSAMLGDTTLANMTAIPASVFANPDVRLRVWFNDGTNGSQLLTPDQRIAPSAYLADGAVTSAKIATNAVGSTHIAAGAVGSTQLAADAVQVGNISIGAVGSAQIAPGAIGSNQLASTVGLWTASGANIFRTDGNIGIGTTSLLPGFANGSGLVIQRASVATLRLEQTGTPTGVEIYANDAGLNFEQFNTNRSFIFKGGNIGIGTVTPQEKLDVAGNIAVSSDNSIIARYTNQSMDYSSSLAWSSLQLGNNGANYIIGGRTSPGGNLVFVTDNTNDFLHGVVDPNGREVMRLTHTGNVGIGTATPSTSLEVAGNDPSNPIAVFKQSNPANLGRLVIDSPTDDASRPSLITLRRAGIDRWSVGGVYESDSFGIGNDASLAGQKMVVTTTGNVGIGTSAPPDRLVLSFAAEDSRRAVAVVDETGGQLTLVPTGGGVANSSYGNIGYNFFAASPSQLQYRGGFNSAAGAGFGANGINLWTADPGTANTNLTPDVRLTVALNGNVGIGAVEPQSKLDVAGTVKATAFQGNGSGLTGLTAANLTGAITGAQIASSTIVNANIGAGAAIAATKLGTGVVDNTELGFLDGVTSSIQTQLGALNTTLGGKVNRAGDTMTGPLTLPNNGLSVGGTQFVAANGNVGIGTTNPEEKLHLGGNMLIAQTLGSSAFDRPTQIVIGNAFQKRLGLGLFDNGTGVLQSYEINVGYHPLAINPSGGNVGIGTTTPQAKLSVAGAVESTSGGFKFPDSTVQKSAASITSFFNVRNYGAVGDGTNDDTPAFTAAIQAIKGNGGGTLFVPKGTYWLTSKLTIDVSVALLGEGRRLSILRWPAANGGIRFEGGDQGGRSKRTFAMTSLSLGTMVAQGGRAVEAVSTVGVGNIGKTLDIRDCDFYTDSLAAYWDCCVWLDDIRDTTIANCDFRGPEGPLFASGVGIRIGGNLSPTTHCIDNCLFAGLDQAINVVGTVEGVTVRNCVTVGNRGFVWDTNLPLPLFAVSDCHFDTITDGISLRNAGGVFIQHCLFFPREGNAAARTGVAVGPGCTDVRISGCNFARNSPPDNFNGVIVDAGANRTRVENNTIVGARTGIWLRTGSTNSYVLDNLFSLCDKDVLNQDPSNHERELPQ